MTVISLAQNGWQAYTQSTKPPAAGNTRGKARANRSTNNERLDVLAEISVLMLHINNIRSIESQAAFCAVAYCQTWPHLVKQTESVPASQATGRFTGRSVGEYHHHTTLSAYDLQKRHAIPWQEHSILDSRGWVILHVHVDWFRVVAREH